MLDLWSKKLLSGGGKAFKPWTMVYLTTNGTVGGDTYAAEGITQYAWCAFTAGTEWNYTGDYRTAFYTYYSPYPLRVSKVYIGIAQNIKGGSVGYSIEGSNDNTQWTTLMPTTTMHNPKKDFIVNATEGYKYIRFKQSGSAYDGVYLGNVTIYADAQY